MPRTEKTRQKILDCSSKLFYKNGYRSTGVQAVAEACNVTKATLYHHFKDKDELIEESLKYLSDKHRRGYMEAWAREKDNPVDKLTVLFDEMAASFKDAEFYGCPFINAAGEYSNRSAPARRVCEQHYAFLISHLEQFAREAKLRAPEELAEGIAAIIAGAYTAWFVGGMSNSAATGKEAALMLIARHMA